MAGWHTTAGVAIAWQEAEKPAWAQDWGRKDRLESGRTGWNHEGSYCVHLLIDVQSLKGAGKEGGGGGGGGAGAGGSRVDWERGRLLAGVCRLPRQAGQEVAVGVALPLLQQPPQALLHRRLGLPAAQTRGGAGGTVVSKLGGGGT